MGSQDVKIAEYQKRLFEMVLADVDPRQPFEEQQKEAEGIMTRLLGTEWKSRQDAKEEPADPSEDYLARLDKAGDDYGLGRAPGVEPGFIEPSEHGSKIDKLGDTASTIKTFMTSLMELLSKVK